MNVLQVGKFLPPPYAGIEAHVEQLITTLQPEIACELMVAQLGWRRRAATPRPYPVHAVRTLATVASTPLCPAMPWQLRHWSKQHPGAIVHVHLPNPMADLSSQALPRDTPLVLTWHSDIVRQTRLLKLYWPLLRRLLARADRVIAFTPQHITSSTQLGGVPADKLRVVPVAVDPARFLRTPAVAQAMQAWRARLGEGPLIASVGRHVYYKGYTHLLSALAGLPAEVRLVLVGSGPLTPALQAQATSLGIADRVHFSGALPDVQMVALLHACDVFCLPSIEPSEAFGLATAEAMLCGKPCVVCELGNGVNHLNRHGVTGLTVPPRDVGALTEALATLVNDSGLRQRLGGGARDWVTQEFSPARMKAGTLALYRELA